MAVYFVKSTDPGAPPARGVNGQGITVFNFILNTTAGLTILYTGTNRAIYAMPNGDVLRCYHDSAVSGAAQLMLVRAAESATGIDAITDPYPTVALVADNACNVVLSNTASAVDRAWWAIVDTSTTTGCFYFFVEGLSNDIANGMLWAGGTTISALPTDNYAAVLEIRASTATTYTTNPPSAMAGTFSTGSGQAWLKRSQDGTIKSSRTTAEAGSGSSLLGAITNAPAIPSPNDNKIHYDAVSVNDYYSQTTTPGTKTEVKRLWMPRLFKPLHAGASYAALPLGYDWEDTAYGASAKFAIFKFGSASGNSGALIVQYDGTWVRPAA